MSAAPAVERSGPFRQFSSANDSVARDMTRLAALGLKGIAVSFVNYLDELPYFCAEVLPRLARSGLRDGGTAGRPRAL